MENAWRTTTYTDIDGVIVGIKTGDKFIDSGHNVLAHARPGLVRADIDIGNRFPAVVLLQGLQSDFSISALAGAYTPL